MWWCLSQDSLRLNGKICTSKDMIVINRFADGKNVGYRNTPDLVKVRRGKYSSKRGRSIGFKEI